MRRRAAKKLRDNHNYIIPLRKPSAGKISVKKMHYELTPVVLGDVRGALVSI